MLVKERAIKLLKEGKVKIISDNDRQVLIDVDEKIVRIFNKQGRTLVSCTCENHVKFCKEQPLCKHKLAAEMLWVHSK